MTSRERMLIAMNNGQPDMVPVAPDASNMIPCRLTGKDFWDIYLYQDPPLWEAYIDCAKHFGFDGWQPAVPYQLEAEMEAVAQGPQWREAIVQRTPERIYTRSHAKIDGVEHWSGHCTVYYIADPPTWGVPLKKVGLPEGPPESWEDVEPRTSYPGLKALERAQMLMGEDGVVGIWVGIPALGLQADDIFEYYDNPSAVIARCEQHAEACIKQAHEVAKIKPDFVLTGGSGLMISNPEPIFRQLGLPTLKAITKILKDAGVPTQIHCCGPEYSLVKISAEETDLTSINPLEIPPMGDCDLAELKRDFGDKISLMGNLHTTEVMLKGSPETVTDAAKRAIDDAGEGGGFILSTGDQCGRDTPDENIMALIEVARTYGRY